MKVPISLEGAALQPYEASRTRYAPVVVPLDAPLVVPYARTIDELVGMVFETQDEASSTRYRITVLSAEVSANSDFHEGLRADYGKKLLDVTVRAHLVEDAVGNDFFGDEDVLVVAGGYNASESGDFGVLEENQAEDFQFVFELDETGQEFTFSINTFDDEWPAVSVSLSEAG